MAIPFNKRTHRCGELRLADQGKDVLLAGWVNNHRDHGGMVFVNIRDRTGVTQLKFDQAVNPEAYQLAGTLHREDVIAVKGTVVARGENVNPDMPTGEVEVEAYEVELLNKADPPPIDIADDVDVSEELRLKYRFLDLRRRPMQEIMKLRHRICKAVRDYFDANDFLEVETPFLTKSTPEGARDYLVPSRVQPGTFFALPQSPQLFKQLLMIAGFDRYAQIVRCFRDEDLRADRQPEFTQVDVEMSFVDRDDVMSMIEGCVKDIFKKGIGVDVGLPFRRMTYAECMERYGIDRPDTRFGAELQDVTELAGQTDFSVFRDAIADGGVVKCIVVPGAEKLTRKITDGLAEEVKGIGGRGLPLTKVVKGQDGPEFSTGVAKFVQPICHQLCEQVGAKIGDAVFFMPGKFDDVCKYLHYTRTRLAEILDLIPDDRWDLLWVIDFPLVVWDDDEQRWFSTHHPFTSPMDEDIELLETDPGKARAKAYDLVLNGSEMAGGSIRIHRNDIQKRVFGLLGISEEEAQVKFQFLLDALRFGAPPHGGIAMGLDRWVLSLGKQQSLRDVIAFPKTQRAVCPLTEAPSEVSEEQLRELGIDLRPEVKAKHSVAPEASSAHTGQHLHKHGG